MLEIMSRSEWGAKGPRHRAKISTPTSQLWLHHSAGHHSGAAGVKAIQDQHMRVQGWSDIGYSFLVDPVSLDVFEGRGAGIRGSHTLGRNSVSHGICVMGNFEHLEPSDALVDRLSELLAHGHAKGWWPAEFSGGHRDVSATACPGGKLYPLIARINGNKGAIAVPAETDPEVREWQHYLLSLGKYLGSTGPNGDGVDGDFGPTTRDHSINTDKWLRNHNVDLDRRIAELKDITNEQVKEIDRLRKLLAKPPSPPVDDDPDDVHPETAEHARRYLAIRSAILDSVL